ncbi:MAG: HAD family hydrolase [Haloechinothrix sp.]
MEFALAPTEPRSAPPYLEFWDRPALRAVCLDIDDTLIDFTSASRRALASMIGRADMWELWECVTDRHVAMVVAGDLEYATMHRQRTKCFLAELGLVIEDAVAARFERQRAATMRLRFRLYHDVLSCLDWLLAAGVRIAAVTNASGGHQRKKLADLGLSRFVDHVAIAGEVGANKPDPLIFHSACAALDCDPAEAVHVGDRLGTDAVGARDAGLAGVWLNRGSRTTHVPAGVHQIGGLDELPELLVCEFATIGMGGGRQHAMPVPR